MKNLFSKVTILTLFVSALSFFSFTQDDKKMKEVDDPFEKKIEVMLMTAMESVEKLNKASGNDDFMATIEVGVDDNPSKNVIIISKVNPLEEMGLKSAAFGGSCRACGVRSGWDCYRRIRDYVEDNNLDSVELSARRDRDGCWNVNYR